MDPILLVDDDSDILTYSKTTWNWMGTTWRSHPQAKRRWKFLIDLDRD